MPKLLRALSAFLCIAALLIGQPVAAQQAMHSVATLQDLNESYWHTEYAGTPLNLTGYTHPFSDQFTTPGCPEIGAAFSAPAANVKFWAQTGASGGANGAIFAGITSANNPYSCGPSGLTMTLSYNGSVWQGAQMATIPYYNNTGGFMAAQGVWEVTAVFPAAPTGLCPWTSVWFESGTAQPYLYASNETDLFESCLQSSTTTTSQVTTFHKYGGVANTGQNGPYAQAWTMPFNIFDGVQHIYWMKTTANWKEIGIDATEVARWPILSIDEQTPDALLIDITNYFAPTASTSTTYSMTIKSVDFYACPASGCS